MSLSANRVSTCLVYVGLLLLCACGGGGGGGGGDDTEADLSAFPPMANDNPPGASVAAVSTAAAMGRGVNFGNMLESPNEGEWGLFVTEEFFQKAVEAPRFATVRLPVRWSNHASATAPYAIDPVFFNRVENVVDRLLADGHYVVLNMHHHRQLDGDALDVNEFAVAANVLDIRFLTLWRQIADRFKNKSDHLLFEIYNEPHNRLTFSKWNDMAARALNVIRQTNPSRIVVIGPGSWNNASSLANLRLPNDANLIATIHNYEPFNFTHQGATWVTPVFPTGRTCCNPTQVAQIRAPLVTAANWSIANGYPVFLGEFGAYSAGAMTERVNYTRIVRDEAEARGMSWTYWELASGFGVYDQGNPGVPGDGGWYATLRNALMGP